MSQRNEAIQATWQIDKRETLGGESPNQATDPVSTVFFGKADRQPSLKIWGKIFPKDSSGFKIK